jgi:hypothetical protein
VLVAPRDTMFALGKHPCAFLQMGKRFCSNACMSRIVPALGLGAALLVLAACQSAPPPVDDTATLAWPAMNALGARQARESAMNSVWQNQTLSELVAAKGPPKMVLHIPGGGNPPGFVVVFGTDPSTGCVDAFALTYDTDPRVRIYHCR